MFWIKLLLTQTKFTEMKYEYVLKNVQVLVPKNQKDWQAIDNEKLIPFFKQFLSMEYKAIHY